MCSSSGRQQWSAAAGDSSAQQQWSAAVRSSSSDNTYSLEWASKHAHVPCVLSHPQMIQQGTNNVYPEVEGLSLLLNFKTQNAGCCKVSGT
jgi:hypothetical protein